jgi:hypothetical protein
MSFFIILIQIIGIGSIAILLLNKKIFNFFGNIISDVYPMQLLTGIIGACLLLMAFVISFHSNVFTDNDKYNDAKDSNGAKRNGYNWLSLIDVYRFPLNQFLLDDHFPDDNMLNFSEEPDRDDSSDYHLIILDKTKSTLEDELTKEILKKPKKELGDKIIRSSLSSIIPISSFKKISDLLALATAVDAIEQGKINIAIGLYGGRNIKQKEYIDYVEYPSNSSDKSPEDIKLFINTFVSKNDSCEKIEPMQYSDFVEMFKNIQESSLSKERIKDLPIVLTLVSDFNDDYPSNKEEDFRDEMEKLFKLNVKQMNLIVLTHENKSYSDKASKILEIIKKTFEHKVLVERVSSTSNEMKKDAETCLGRIITNPNRPLGGESEISSFFPYHKPYSLRAGRTEFYIMNGDEYYQDVVSICIKPIGDSVNRAKAILDESWDNMYVGKPIDIVPKKGKISFIFPRDLRESGEYYMDIYSKNIQKRILAPIVFRERLTYTSSKSLIFLYSLLYDSSAVFLLILGWGFWHYNLKINCEIWYRRIYAIIFSLSVVIPILSFKFLLESFYYSLSLLHSIDSFSDFLKIWDSKMISLFFTGFLPLLFIIALVWCNRSHIKELKDDPMKFYN